MWFIGFRHFYPMCRSSKAESGKATKGKKLLGKSWWIFENILEALFPSFGEAQADKRKHSGGLKCSERISIKPLEFSPSTFFKHSQ